eukprot:symbB.v1.2.020589.t1/scaffold1691.1/size105682/6
MIGWQWEVKEDVLHCGAMESLEGTTWEQLASRYDGFIFDLFGVLHNGAVALPGAVDLIQKLKRMDKQLVILSNSSKRSAWAFRRASLEYASAINWSLGECQRRAVRVSPCSMDRGHCFCVKDCGSRGAPVADDEFALEGVTHIKGIKSLKQLKGLPESLQTLTLGESYNMTLAQVKLPEHLQNFILGQSFNQSLEKVCLPKHLESLTFGNDFNQPLRQVILPDIACLKFGARFAQSLQGVKLPNSIQSLTFGVDFNQSLEGITLPSGLQSLTFGSSFNQTLQAVKLPTSLKILSFGRSFNQSLEGVTLPTELQSLKLGDGFNQNLDHLPQKLSDLSLGDRFNQPLDQLIWPCGLQSLTLGAKFEQSFEEVTFPTTLQSLRFGSTTNLMLRYITFPEHLQSLHLGLWYEPNLEYVSSLPSSLQSLTLDIRHPSCEASTGMTMILPRNLQSLTFGPRFKQNLQGVTFPSSLQSLTFGTDFNQSLEQVKFPSNLQKLVLGFSFKQRLQQLDLPKLQNLTLGYSFNHTLEQVDLPATLQSLTFGYSFDQSLEKVRLPDNLQHLTFGDSFNRNLEQVKLPQNLQSLKFGLEFQQSLDGVKWPIGLEELAFGYMFNSSLDRELSKFGLEASAFQGAITSGEEAWKILASEKWNGKSCIWLAKADGSGVTEYLEGTGVKLAPEVQEADFILNSGTNTIRTSSATKHVDCETTGDLEQYRDLFCKAIARSLPMICANPDFRSPAKPGAKETFQPGHVARFYEELGGAVTYYGKPGAAHFEAARRLLGYDLAIAHVGDSFFHDVCGAAAANVPVVFVAGGIDHQELGIQPGELPTAKALQRLVERYHVQPNHVVPLAMWTQLQWLLEPLLARDLERKEMFDAGYQNQTAVDISQVVTEHMEQRNRQDRPSIHWITADCRQLTEIPSDSFPLVVDKSTLDAFFCHDQHALAIMEFLKEDCLVRVMGTLIRTVFGPFGAGTSMVLSILIGALYDEWAEPFPRYSFLTSWGSVARSVASGLIMSCVGPEILLQFAKERMATLQKEMDKFQGSMFRYMLFLGVSPLFPKWFVNYATAMIGMPFQYFLVASTFLEVLLGWEQAYRVTSVGGAFISVSMHRPKAVLPWLQHRLFAWKTVAIAIEDGQPADRPRCHAYICGPKRCEGQRSIEAHWPRLFQQVTEHPDSDLSASSDEDDEDTVAE